LCSLSPHRPHPQHTCSSTQTTPHHTNPTNPPESGKPVPGCVKVRTADAAHNAAWLGECGRAPSLATTLPVEDICAPAAAAAADCLAPAQLAAGFAVKLPTAATCGERSGHNVRYRGARCGQRGRFIQWSRVTLEGPEGEETATCERAASPTAKRAGAAAVSPVMADAHHLGACGVPPMIYRELPTEICERGAVPVLNLPKPQKEIATGAWQLLIHSRSRQLPMLSPCLKPLSLRSVPQPRSQPPRRLNKQPHKQSP
jgi:hypothetical protein